jgi:hypothetical protein
LARVNDEFFDNPSITIGVFLFSKIIRAILIENLKLLIGVLVYFGYQAEMNVLSLNGLFSSMFPYK